MTSVADAPPEATADVVATGTGKPHRRWNLTLVAGATLVSLVVLTAVLSFLWTPYDPTRVNPAQTLVPPSSTHWLGTDHFGRDIVSQLLVGARTTLFVGVVAVTISAAVGVPLGLLAATGRRWISEPVMRVLDIVFAFPAILLAIILAAGFNASTLTGMIAIGVANVPVFGRLTRAGALQVLQSDFVLAARSYGRRGVVLMVRYVLPNIAALLIVQASVSFAHAVLAEAALSYLGYGTPPPTPTWGRMLQEAQNYFVVQPMLAVWPGLAIALSVLGFNLMGDGLRDALDPRLRGR
ncbi:peptide ABC transporter permease [Micromonospora qiuiae]|uniref:Peptide ABC transporter permease n=1 Tax=Micromonospora qiuiae TaxID=502268 RepID=A0ABQ4JHH6_9ACTN|nr:ABC transporter permease [Micromonospora qiuiae]GIJ30070.1 peptide ABC transporter permease [Micromonospora qiuiae]